MADDKLPEFESVEELVKFFDTHDMGQCDLPDAQFDVDIKKRTFLVSVDEELMKKLSQVARAQHTSTEALVNSWLKERAAQVS